jgi:hypothetical protein
MKHRLLKTALCLCLLLPACNNQPEDKRQPSPKQESTKLEDKAPTTTEKAATAAAVTPQNSNTIIGKIVETMNSGGYTYLLIDTGKAQQWVAIPESSVKVGDTVSCQDGMEMPNFTSKTLNRTFDSLVFSAGIAGQAPSGPHGAGSNAKNSDVSNPHIAKTESSNGADSFSSALKAEGSPAPGVKAKMESGGSVGAMAPAVDIKVDKAVGENSYTVAEIFADNTKLDGKTARVQGKVVKFSPNIMGKNWIHIQDGSGDPLKNTHDLVITTSAEPPKDNSIITIEGIVRANKDFGAGYSYVVLIEEAKIIQ